MNPSLIRFYTVFGSLPRRAHTLLTLLFFWVTLLAPLTAEPFVFVPGDLPLLIVAPHGGDGVLEGAEIRQKDRSTGSKFAVVRDLVTTDLAQLYSDEIYRATENQARPSLLYSNTHRRYCDLNRSEEHSSHDPVGRKFHRRFHQTIQNEVERLSGQFGWVLIVDVHGQSAEPVDLLIGTRGGTTISSWSKSALWGQEGIIPSLLEAGFSVLPPEPQTKVRFNGGFTVTHYAHPPQVETWQFEHGRELRFNEEANRVFTRLVAERLVEFIATRDSDRQPLSEE